MKVYKFIFPIDFVVLEMEEDIDVPIILGRPFLATSQALIDVKHGELTLRIGEDEVKFKPTKIVVERTRTHVYKFMTLSPKDYYLIPGVNTIKLVE